MTALDVLAALPVLLALTTAAAAVRRSRSPGGPRRRWAVLGAAAAAWAVGTALLGPGSTLHLPPWSALLGTAALLCWPVLLVGALALLSSRHQTRQHLARDLADCSTVVAALTTAVWVFAVQPVAAAAPSGAVTAAVTWASCLAVAAVVTVVHAALRSPERSLGPWCAHAGAVIVVAGDVFTLYQQGVRGPGADPVAVGAWALGWALVLAGTLAPPRRSASPAGTGLLGGNTVSTAAAVVLVVVAAWHAAARSAAPDHVSTLLGATALLALVVRTLLVLLRTSRLQRDLTRRVQERTLELETSQRRFAALVAHTSDLVLVVDADGLLVHANPGAARLLGLDPERATGRPVSDHLLLEDGAGAAGGPLAVLRAMSAGGLEQVERPLVLRHADGHRVDVEAVATDLLDDPDVAGVVINARDTTEARRLERELSERAFNDALTGLPNRALFRDRLEHALLSRASHGPVEVLYLDLDGFKAVNDTLGHDAGDELLVAVADRLRSALRPADTVARLGGDEFALLLGEGAQPEQVAELAQRLCDAVRRPFTVREVPVQVGTSIGLASSRVAGRDAEALMRSADLAMYQAKSACKGGYAVYHPGMHRALLERVQMEADLRSAVEQGQFRVVYQPLVDMGTGGVSGVEALVRWDRPEHGVVAPAEFIPLAESTGLIDAIGSFVLRRACQQVATWRAEVPGAEQMRVSVNLSGHQLRDPGLVSEVLDVLAETDLPAASLVLEITESVFVGQDDDALEALEALRALGVRLAIDDFGTGYSSLSYLHRLPVDIIKIDKSFVDRLSAEGDTSLVVTILEMARVLGLATVAEGVEHEHQREVLTAQGVVTGQGYRFSPPVEAHLLPELVTGVLLAPSDAPASSAPALRSAREAAGSPGV